MRVWFFVSWPARQSWYHHQAYAQPMNRSNISLLPNEQKWFSSFRAALMGEMRYYGEVYPSIMMSPFLNCSISVDSGNLPWRGKWGMNWRDQMVWILQHIVVVISKTNKVKRVILSSSTDCSFNAGFPNAFMVVKSGAIRENLSSVAWMLMMRTLSRPNLKLIEHRNIAWFSADKAAVVIAYVYSDQIYFILDEPTTGMDAGSKKWIYELIPQRQRILRLF